MWTRTAFGQLCVCACLLIPTTEQTTAAFVVLPLNHRLRVAANNTHAFDQGRELKESGTT